MSTRVMWLLVLGLVLAPHGAGAQPTPEHKKMEAAVGKFRIDIDVRASPAAPASKASGTEDCQWFANLHVVCRTEATGPAGLYSSMRTMSYLAALKQYASYSVDSLGFAIMALGTSSGNTWTFNTDLPGMKMRVTMKTSREGYTAVSEYAGADGKWITTSEIKATRMK